MGQYIKEVKSKMWESEEDTTRMMRRKEIVQQAKAMAACLIKRLKEGGMFEAFAKAGR